MRCHFCGRTDALIRGIELPVARFTLRAHVDCKGHSEYRAVSHKEVEESNKAFTRYLDHAPEMVDCLHTARTLLSTVAVAASWNDDTIKQLVPECRAFMAASNKLLTKIEGGGE